MIRILKWIKKEILEILPAIIYFAIAFNLIYIDYGLRLQSGQKHYFSQLSVTLSALIVGKVLLIANHLPIINLFAKKPLIYTIVWKFIVYNSFVVLFWIAETCFHLYWHGHTSAEFIANIISRDFQSAPLWATQITLWMVFLVFIVFHELTRAIGKKKIINLLFG